MNLKIFAITLSIFLAVAFNLKAEVWGIKSFAVLDVPSQSSAPADLFHFSEAGTEFQTVGPITVAGNEIDADGLAMDNQGTLYAFEISTNGSRLLTLDPNSAVGTPIGPFLDNLAIRGAVITLTGQLLVLDSNASQLLQISVLTGEIIGNPVSLTSGGVPYLFSFNGVCDLAESPDGVFLVTDVNRFLQLDAASGILTLLDTDNGLTQDGYTNALCGLTFSQAAADPNRMFAYNVNGQDDIFTYDYDHAFARTEPYPNIISAFNSGRGDLAAQIRPLLHVALTDPQDVTLSWTTNAPGYILESTGALGPANWNVVPNTSVTVGAQFTVPVATTNAQQFFRLHLP
jgi:hypothetical protein